MTLNLQLPAHEDILKPTITVVGVGGAGGNAVNNMIAAQLDGVDFVVANTDAQALAHARASKTVQLGGTLTKGLGAGANPDMGRAAAEEAADEIARYIEGSNMVFITAGMGGGTGTGAAPVVARIARDQGILTVAVVTKPFQFEGVHRMRLAETGLNELQQYVDTLIIIPNQNLFRIANERTTFADAFKLADEVLHSGVRGVTDLMVKPGLINLDFADIRAVMQEMGKAMMGTGESTGDRRAIEAAEAAISNPLLDDVSLKGAKALLINITGGPDMTLFEVDEAANRVRQEVDPDANIIFGSAFNDGMEGRMRVSVVATGIDTVQASNNKPAGTPQTEAKKPYIFAPSRPEPVKIQTRTAQDMPREFAQQAQPQRSQARSSAPAMTEQPKPAPRAAEPKAEAKPAIVAAVEEAPVLSVTGVEALFVSESGLAPEQFTPAMRESMPNKVNLTPQPRQEAAPAPRSEAPQVRDVMASISPREEARESYDDKELPSTRSLFQRIADVSRVLATRPEAAAAPRAREISVPAVDDAIEREQRIVTERAAERSLQVKENTRRDPRTAALFDEDQFIDIPAFLRRQAN